jgi:SnoaL-like domain
VELWELTARERIRDALARYNWSGDAFLLEELAGVFCPDGELEIRGSEPLQGREAIVAFLGGGSEPGGDEARRAVRKAEAEAAGVTRIVRHNVANIRFVEVTPERARVEGYFTVLTEIGLDHHGRYRDLFVPVGDEWLIRHRYVSTDWRSPQSTMAPR